MKTVMFATVMAVLLTFAATASPSEKEQDDTSAEVVAREALLDELLREADEGLEQAREEELRLEELLLALGNDGKAVWDQPLRQRRKGGFGKAGKELPERRHLEQLRILKLLELLDLRENQELEFLTAFRDVRKQHRQLEAEKRELLGRLAFGLETGNIEDEEVFALVEHYAEIEQARHSLNQEFVDHLRSILTAKQLGKFVVFQERFEAELLEKVKSFRQRPRPGLKR